MLFTVSPLMMSAPQKKLYSKREGNVMPILFWDNNFLGCDDIGGNMVFSCKSRAEQGCSIRQRYWDKTKVSINYQ